MDLIHYVVKDGVIENTLENFSSRQVMQFSVLWFAKKTYPKLTNLIILANRRVGFGESNCIHVFEAFF